MPAPSQEHDNCNTLIPIRIDRYDRGAFDHHIIEEASLLEDETRIAAAGRFVDCKTPEMALKKFRRAHDRKGARRYQ